ncbi:MAG: ammonia-forming cytochrome c nitrite reductase subunit c552 [Planctomycetia bacterium]|nr:ammonia-forming cytochrome c nitrite reductase subunit c552 [Planctomycetia bacterium]
MNRQSPVHFRYSAKIFYLFTILVVAAATVGVILLLQNVTHRKEEAKQHVFRVVEVTEDTIDPVVWGKNYPRQYDGYRRTVDTERTRHGGSDAFNKLEEDPRWREIFKGYAFGVDYREDRGHAYMLSDQDITERIKIVKQPGACLHCHSSIIPAYREAGIKAGVPAGEAYRQEQIMKGFEIVCAMPYDEARKMVSHPVSCVDCHDPDTLQLRVTRPAFLNAIRVLASSDYPLPHLPSIERWRTDGRKGEYDVNTMATRQEMRSFACGQCHVEYYFKGEGKFLTYPWQKGLRAEQIEGYYDEIDFKDWTHKASGAQLLKAQHPEFEMWSQGIHARSGVACADCHMPYKREGAIKISDHHVRSPLMNVSNTCQTCHHFSESELKARVELIQDRTRDLMSRAEVAVVALIHDLQRAQEFGISAEQLKAAQALHRKAQWRLDFVAAENSMGFHAPQEAARILGEAIDYARQGQIEVLKLEPLAH